MADPTWLPEALDALEAAGLRRDEHVLHGHGPHVLLPDGKKLLNLAGNDYLSLSRTMVSGVLGTASSRLLAGTALQHTELEHRLAGWLGFPSALLFSSGYAANTGAIAALASADTHVFSDALNHASIIDGCRLSRALVSVYRHADLAHLDELLRRCERPHRLIVSESYFSMDGDGPDLVALRALADRYGATLYLDEAHALGVFGPEGRGLAATQSVRPDVLLGTFGKAFGGVGAFVACSPTVRAWLFNRARSFVFSTATSPLLADALTASLERIREGTATKRLAANVDTFRAELASAGALPLAESRGPIIPILLGASRRATAVAKQLQLEGVFALPVRPPTVPEGTARLRLTVQAGHDPEDLRTAAHLIARTLRQTSV